MTFTQQDVRGLLVQPEGESLEFKSSIPDASALARIMAAFSNTSGGILIIGAQEGGHLVGVDERRAENVWDNALNHLGGDGVPSIGFQGIEIDGKELVLITVPKHDKLTLAEGAAFERAGDRITPMSPERILRARQPSRRQESQETPSLAGNEVVLAEAVYLLTSRIETLEGRIVHANSFRGQLANYVVGGFIGAVLGLLLSLLFA